MRAQEVVAALLRDSRGVIGVGVITVVLLTALFGEMLSPYAPTFLSDAILSPPQPGHLLGTDRLGRDVLSQTIAGATISLQVGLVAAVVSAMVGATLGAIAGYFGGSIDEVVSTLINVFMLMPAFFLALVFAALFGGSATVITLVIGLTFWPTNARLMRAQAIEIRERGFVRAAIAGGVPGRTILARHVIPNGIYPVIANSTLLVALAIVTEASLSFLGVGDANRVSWGRMIYEGRSTLTTGWWASVFPGLAVVLTALGFYLLGDSLNDALRTRRRS